jgi:hypothetical protein
MHTYLRDFYYKKSGYMDQLLELSMLSDLLPEGRSLYVDKVSGLVTSSRTLTEEQVVNMWSNLLYTEESTDIGYSSHHPYSLARLEYTVSTVAQFLMSINSFSSIATICDFAAGTGASLSALRRYFPAAKIFSTEASKKNTELMLSQGFDRSEHTDLGFSVYPGRKLFSDSPIDLAIVTWTLCNCINPLDVILEVVENLNVGGFVCIAESSRILVDGYRKSLADYLGPQELDPDLHPFHWSFNSLYTLLALAGLNVVHSNRYQDNDSLVLIAQKQSIPSEPRLDDYQFVIKYFQGWQAHDVYVSRLKR